MIQITFLHNKGKTTDGLNSDSLSAPGIAQMHVACYSELVQNPQSSSEEIMSFLKASRTPLEINGSNSEVV